MLVRKVTHLKFPFVQSPLKRKNDKESGLCRLLTIQDKVVAWLSYLSLVELGQLPRQLYDPADSRPGRIVSKVCASSAHCNSRALPTNKMMQWR